MRLMNEDVHGGNKLATVDELRRKRMMNGRRDDNDVPSWRTTNDWRRQRMMMCGGGRRWMIVDGGRQWCAIADDSWWWCSRLTLMTRTDVDDDDENIYIRWWIRHFFYLISFYLQQSQILANRQLIRLFSTILFSSILPPVDLLPTTAHIDWLASPPYILIGFLNEGPFIYLGGSAQTFNYMVAKSFKTEIFGWNMFTNLKSIISASLITIGSKLTTYSKMV